MDRVYNSELFAPHFSDGLEFTPAELKKVIEGLYQKHYIRYNFNALEADVLGTVYEQYLGAVVADKSEAAGPKKKGEKQPELISEGMTVQERRAKRKSQGIYYTPSFVTKYIVQQTVGKYLEENGYNASKPPRILDMACGSGSFLIKAFDVVDRYVMNLRHQTSDPLRPSDTSPKSDEPQSDLGEAGGGQTFSLLNCVSYSWAYNPLSVSNSSCVPRSTICPLSITRIKSAASIVDKRWAITMLVRPAMTRFKAS
jgi:hypothetical protein